MKSPLHILNLEDDPRDAALIKKTLVAGGITCALTCVTNRADFVAALEQGGADLILSDFTLPAFDGLSALEIVRARFPAIPLIFVSGTLGEERAIESLKSGATDYILKENLTRLVPSVRRAMQEVEERAGNRRTEEALRESEQRLRIVFNESTLGIALVGLDGRSVLTNAALQKMLGYTSQELSRMNFQDFTHPEDRAKDSDLYNQLALGTRHDYQMEKRYIRKDGQVIWGRLSVSVACETVGQTGFAIRIVEDITERRALEAQFIEAQKMEVVGRLAGGVAHDFNNILFVIMGYNDFIMSDLPMDSSLRKYSEQIRHAAERAGGLTRQLLVFSRKQTVMPVVLDLADVVKDSEKMLRRLIDENIEMTIVPGKQIGCIMADSGYVGQVLMNLAVNARDAMPTGGKLTISTNNVTLDQNAARAQPGAIPGDYVTLGVTDTGTGIPDEVKAHLFEAFFTTKPLGKGTGLGLATCQTIVQQCGGHIAVDSEVGKGTTFTVYFPRFAQEPPLAAKPPQPMALQPRPSLRGTETLLVVEDDPSVRYLARRVLEGQGYGVLSASNGQDALNLVREHTGPPIELAITDVVMPQMGGKAMADWLKTNKPDLKILYTSGYTDDALSHHGVLEPGVEFLPKPYTPAALGRKVRAMLDEGKSNNEISTTHPAP